MWRMEWEFNNFGDWYKSSTILEDLCLLIYFYIVHF